MNGKQIYFTHQEIIALICTLQEWQDLLGTQREDIYSHRLICGLGTAWDKLFDAENETN